MRNDLSDRLHDLASEMPVDLERGAPPTLRRARRRRWTNAATIGLVTVGIALAGIAGLRALAPEDRATVIGGTGPTAPRGDPAETGPDGDELAIPAAVEATRAAIVEAARARDFDALLGLLDPMTFAYNFGDGSNPIPEWRADPAVLDTLVQILAMKPAIRHTQDFGDLYVWPYLMEADLTSLTPDDLDLLAALGITAAKIDEMIAFGAYIGPRTTIAADGRWLNYVTGGD